jgi:hypothetical protein
VKEKMAPQKKAEALFEMLEENAAQFPVEYLRLTDGEEWWQGVLVYDERIPDTRKNFLVSTISRLSRQDKQVKNNALARKDSCQVSPEERAQLFSFLKSGAE